jgi:alpha-galactosidase/6-phospho-beta-glucosidase family protein
MILNIPNRGAIHSMAQEDVVEIPALVSKNLVRPVVVGAIPDHCLGLMKQVKAYERLAIEAALENSYSKALQALTLHPLVADYVLAKAILEDYVKGHAGLFPALR